MKISNIYISILAEYLPNTSGNCIVRRLMWGVLLLLIMIAVFYIVQSTEGFATKREKAARIHEWFSNARSHDYASYRGALDHQSNIVEYEDVKKLFDNRDFTVATVEAAI